MALPISTVSSRTKLLSESEITPVTVTAPRTLSASLIVKVAVERSLNWPSIARLPFLSRFKTVVPEAEALRIF